MNLKYISFITFYFFSLCLNATNIRVVDLQDLIDENPSLLNLVSQIENDQLIHREKFYNIEKIIEENLKKIDELKLILSDFELEKEIDTYNQNLNEFNIGLFLLFK